MYPFHMLGHKRTGDMGFLIRSHGYNEVDGFDNLHLPGKVSLSSPWTGHTEHTVRTRHIIWLMKQQRDTLSRVWAVPGAGRIWSAGTATSPCIMEVCHETSLRPPIFITGDRRFGVQGGSSSEDRILDAETIHGYPGKCLSSSHV